MNQVLSKPLKVDVLRQLVSMLGYPIKNKNILKETRNFNKEVTYKINDGEFDIIQKHLIDPEVNNNIDLEFPGLICEESLDTFTREQRVKRKVIK